MPTKPSPMELKAAEVARNNPNFGKDCLEAVINEVPELKQALLKEGLVEEVVNNA